MEIHQTFHRIQFFSQTRVGHCTELQDITIERQFPLYSMQIPLEYQIPRSVRQNSGTQAGFRAEYQGESKDLALSRALINQLGSTASSLYDDAPLVP